MLFLDQNGHDRLTLGEELEPQVGGKLLPPGVHRIASGFGVVLHDGSGDERGAYGWLSNRRALITLDRPGAEACAAIVNDKTGETKIAFNFPPQISGDASAIEIGTKELAHPFSVLRTKVERVERFSVPRVVDLHHSKFSMISGT